MVLRRYVIESLNREEPDIAEREAAALGALERCRLATPVLLGVDPVGEATGQPAVLMSRVPGRLEWSPTDFEPWLRQLAAALPAIHETPPGAITTKFAPYKPASWDPPAWLSDRRLWDRLLEHYHGPRADHDDVVIHRDYHPGNVLFRRGRVVGVVDWQAACLGPRTADVWHCRANLIGRFGLEVADRFLTVWQTITGRDYNPWAETVMLVDTLSWPGARNAREWADFERLVATRLAELG